MEAFRARLRSLLTGFWALPLATAAALAGLGFALVAVDRASGASGVSFGFHGDAQAARSVLSVVAGSLITVAGLTFSLLILTLQLVSGQFTPRAMRRMLADRTTQLVAGVFVGVVAYALIVLRSVRGAGTEDPLSPSLSTTVAIWLTLGALGLLIFFVHHIGVTIQVSAITARVARETLAAVERILPNELGAGSVEGSADEVVASWRAGAQPTPARPDRAGYVQTVAIGDVERALPQGGRAAVHVRAGDFVTGATTAIELWGDDLDDQAVSAAAAAVVVAAERDLTDDIAFGLRQLVDIALRAISPGINDPTTAVTSIGYVQAILEGLVVRGDPAEIVRGDDRMIALRTVPFAEHLEIGFLELGRYAADHTRVVEAILHALERIGHVAHEAAARDRVDLVTGLASRVARPAIDAAATAQDRDDLGAGLASVMAMAERSSR